MIFQFISYMFFGYIGNFYQYSVLEESLILSVFFFTSGILLDYYIPRYYQKQITWYSKKDILIKREIYINKNILRNVLIILFFHIMTIKYFETNNVSHFNNILLLFPIGISTKILFFFTHTHLHSKFLKKYHNVHHEYRNPIAFAGLYSHLFELIYSNIIPVYLPLFIFNINRYYRIAYLISSTIDTFISHLSYYPNNKIIYNFFGFSKYHFIHHQEPKYNRGLGDGIMDKLFGTYKNP